MLGPIVHVRFLGLQRISEALRETLLPFLLFGPLVKHLKMSPEDEDHDDGQPVGRNANRVRVSVSRTPDLGPYVRARDATQLTGRVDERDNHSSL